MADENKNIRIHAENPDGSFTDSTVSAEELAEIASDPNKELIAGADVGGPAEQDDLMITTVLLVNPDQES